MNFKNIAQVIDRFGASEKRVTKNYQQYLEAQFGNWEQLPKTYNEDHQQYRFNSAGVDVVITHQGRFNHEVKQIKLITGQEKVIIRLNRRKNATLFKFYQSETGRHLRDEYRDGQNRTYLIYYFNRRNRIKSYRLNFLDQDYDFQTSADLLAFLNQVETPVNYQRQMIEIQQVRVNKAGLILDDELLKQINEARWIDRQQQAMIPANLQAIDATKKEITWPDNLEAVVADYELQLLFRGIYFTVTQNGIEKIPVDQREILLSVETASPVIKLGYSHQKHLVLKVMNEQTALDSVNLSGSPIFVSDVTEIGQIIQIKLALVLTKVKNVTFFQKIGASEQDISIQALDVADNLIVFQKHAWLDDHELYIRYQQENGNFQQKLVSFSQWLRAVVQQSNVQLMTKQNHFELVMQMQSTLTPVGLSLAIRNRGSKETLYLSSDANDENGKKAYQFDVHQFPFTTGITRDNYDGTIYDLLFRLDYPGVSVGKYHVRAKWNHNMPEELSNAYEDDGQVLLNPYGTSNHQELSLRTYFISKEALIFYQSLKKQHLTGHKRNTRPQMVIVESPDRAQDNGLAFFKYLMHSQKQPFDVKYVLTADSADWKNLAGYEDRVVVYKSKEHFELMAHVDLVVHTNSSFYAYPVNTSFWQGYQKRVKKIFLQHGIMGVRDLSRLYGRNPMFTNRYIVSSQREQQMAIQQMGYRPYEVALTGLARFDELLRKHAEWPEAKVRQRILIMPSWRKGQDRLEPDEFMQTDFYRHLTALLMHPDLKDLIKREHLQVDLYLHHNFQRYNQLFALTGVHVISEKEDTVQKLLINHGLLITDFSSVALDFALQNRPVFYYQLDDSLAQKEQQVSQLFPGSIYWQVDELLQAVEVSLKQKHLMVAQPDKLDDLYLQRDTHANDRILATAEALMDTKQNFQNIYEYHLHKVKRKIKHLLKKLR